MSAEPRWSHGPYAISDLPDWDDNRYELVDGWIEMTPWPRNRHEDAAHSLRAILEEAAKSAKADVYVRAPADIMTSRGLRIADAAIIDGPARRAEHALDARASSSADVILAAEIVSPRSTERTDRVDKRTEHAESGIPVYWIVSLEEPQIEVLEIAEGRYRLAAAAKGDDILAVDHPIPVRLRPSDLLRL
jgi:Uma2 family endonuclease